MANNRHFDFLAPVYDQVIRPPDPQRLKELLELPASGWFLDAAGGTGRAGSLLKPLVDHLTVCDLSFEMLRQASNREKLLPCQVRVERLPFPDGQFSRILVSDAFHHFGDQPGALKELTRVLQPGGRLVIQEPDIRRFAVKLIALAENILLMGSRFHAPQKMVRLVNSFGLRASIETQDATVWIIGEKEKA